jgi:hypothetical protein
MDLCFLFLVSLLLYLSFNKFLNKLFLSLLGKEYNLKGRAQQDLLLKIFIRGGGGGGQAICVSKKVRQLEYPYMRDRTMVGPDTGPG